jgi:hypothetical protein
MDQYATEFITSIGSFDRESSSLLQPWNLAARFGTVAIDVGSRIGSTISPRRPCEVYLFRNRVRSVSAFDSPTEEFRAYLVMLRTDVLNFGSPPFTRYGPTIIKSIDDIQSVQQTPTLDCPKPRAAH